MINRIAVTGPESTGKSELCQKLAAYYNTVWVPEYARDYIATLGRAYRTDDLEVIAKKQLEFLQDAEKKAHKLLFADTELLVIKIWFQNAYGYCPKWILDALNKQDFQLYLLCNIDLPWMPDPQREHPDKRNYFFNLYENELKKRKLPYKIISGIGEDRLKNAIEVINQCIA